MRRRDFLKDAGILATGCSCCMPGDLWAKLPSKIKITGLRTRVVADEVYLKVTTNQGVVGEGHATVHRKSATCEAAIKDLERVLVGRDPTRIEFLWQAMYRWPRWRGGPVLNAAISGVDLALWDILGKLLDVPVYRLLGGSARERVRLYIHGSGKEGGTASQIVGLLGDQDKPLRCRRRGRPSRDQTTLESEASGQGH